MYDFYPYFTNDGSIGLFSPADDDIYHSTYGALSESWEKFILPADLESFIENNQEIKILDICFGIGYNSKTAMNIFCKNILKNKKSKNLFSKLLNICAIYTDNISNSFFGKKIKSEEEIISKNDSYIDKIHTDNINNEIKKKLCIHAIEIDKILLELSPFVFNETNSANKTVSPLYKAQIKQKFSNSKLEQIFKLNNFDKKKINNDYKIRNEVQFILYLKLLEQYSKKNINFSNESIDILRDKKFTSFFSKNIVDFSNNYSNLGYITTKNKNKMAFLHNIYYQYISKSYKRAIKILNSSQIELEFHNEDARTYIQKDDVCFDFIFLDAFTPAKCPMLWTTHFFAKLYDKLNPNGMILTYSSSASIRNAFVENGFYLGKIYDSKLNKFIGTIAVKNKDLIKHPLDSYELGLLQTKAGITYKDANLDLSNSVIINNREQEIKQSKLLSSSKYIKEHKNAKSL